MAKVLEQFRSNYSATQAEELSIEEYLELCRREPTTYASAAERMIAGISEPGLVDTRNEQRDAHLRDVRCVVCVRELRIAGDLRFRR